MVGKPNIKHDSVAVVGAAGRFPGASNLTQYWDLLARGAVATASPGADRTELWKASEDESLGPHITTLVGGYLDNIAGFDAAYFNISAREAEKLDPQQRLLMEVTHDAVEDAGILKHELQNSNTGVFIGAGSFDYMSLDSSSKSSITAYHGVGNSHSLLANRLSYIYNLKGLSLTIDTACSSSLTALHVAKRSLQQGEVDIAIVGGVNVIVSPDLTLAFSQAKMLSASGRCNTFGDQADGYARAEGVGVIILKRLADAQASQDQIRCLIRGSAVNQDGRSNGIMAPNGLSQIEVIKNAMENAEVEPSDFAYMEAHGTGTTLGDGIEYQSLKEVFSQQHSNACYFGSAKASIGHAEAAAGICGILKGMLMAEKGFIPPHPVKPPYNRLVDGKGCNLEICSSLQSIPRDQNCIGVSSFGFGGSNAHVVLEQYHQRALKVDSSSDVNCILAISSHHPQTLLADAKNLAELLDQSSLSLSQISNTLINGRDPDKFRYAWAGNDRAKFKTDLLAFTATQNEQQAYSKQTKLAFVFTGQGSQYAEMGKQLYHSHSEYRDVFNDCAKLIQQIAGVDLIGDLYGRSSVSNQGWEENTHLAQLGLFCLEYAIAKFWIEMGLSVDYLIGHSIGEISAHAISGAISIEDAVALVDKRGRLMQAEEADGAMIAVLSSVDEVEKILQSITLPLYLAAVNGDKNVVVSGSFAAVESLQSYLNEHSVASRKLKTRHAFHSPLFNAAGTELSEFCSGLEYVEGAIPTISNLDGSVVNLPQQESDYWGRHMVSTVQFSKGVTTLVEAGVTVFLEVGPGSVLTPLLRRGINNQSSSYVSSLNNNFDDSLSIMNAAASLWSKGVKIQLDKFCKEIGQEKVSLPSRTLFTEKFWTESTSSAACPSETLNTEAVNRISAIQTKTPTPNMHVFERQLKLMQQQINLLEN